MKTLIVGDTTEDLAVFAKSIAPDATMTTSFDSNNAIYPYPAPGTTNAFVASVIVTTGVSLAVDSQATPVIYPILANICN